MKNSMIDIKMMIILKLILVVHWWRIADEYKRYRIDVEIKTKEERMLKKENRVIESN
jgi:hypothetical protein